MTGAFLRVMRDGKLENVEIEHMTNREREEALKDHDAMRWLHVVCDRLAKADNFIGDLETDGLVERVDNV